MQDNPAPPTAEEWSAMKTAERRHWRQAQHVGERPAITESTASVVVSAGPVKRWTEDDFAALARLISAMPDFTPDAGIEVGSEYDPPMREEFCPALEGAGGLLTIGGDLHRHRKPQAYRSNGGSGALRDAAGHWVPPVAEYVGTLS